MTLIWHPDIEGAEEEEGGPSTDNNNDNNRDIKIEPFNMKEERARGYFDEVGTYIEKGSDDDDDDEVGGGGEKDAWLQGEASRAVVSDEVKQKIVARQKQYKEQQQKTQSIAAASQLPLTATQIARLQWQVARILHPGESITRAMKRLEVKERIELLEKEPNSRLLFWILRQRSNWMI